MTFSFGFSGDDIDIDESEIEQGDQGNNMISVQNQDDSLPEPVEAKRHEMGEWIPTLPSQISYNRLEMYAPGNEEKKVTIARREVFDIRAQLMAEDSAEHEQRENEELISGLEQGDIKPNFYEGGFKTWECALDLARLVVDDHGGLDKDEGGDENGKRRVIELGAGTAIPSLALFAQLLLSQPDTAPTQKRTLFTFADYNAFVLRLVTLPNLLLTWNYLVNCPREKPSTSADNAISSERNQDQDDEQEEGEGENEEEEELEITPELLENFQQDLTRRGITIDFISGAWSPAFVDLASSSTGETTGRDSNRTLILASETIYSPSSLGAFSETLLALLRRSAAAETSTSRAMIAAKKVYFGVGGGVDEFLAVLRNIGDDGIEVKQVDIKSEGVGRVVLEVAPSWNTGT